jgi:hypothetical protein
MELSPYNTLAGDQLTDWRLFEPLHPTIPKQYGTKKLMHTHPFPYRNPTRQRLDARFVCLQQHNAAAGARPLAFLSWISVGSIEFRGKIRELKEQISTMIGDFQQKLSYTRFELLN